MKRRRSRFGPLAACVLGFAILALASGAEPPRTLPAGLPADLWEMLIPPDNPVTPEKVALGRKLYYDKRLSKDGTVSCATCHDPDKGFSDGKKVSEGVGGKKGTRNSPTVLNAVFNEFQFWDGRAPSLEEQAKGPMINPVEMGMDSHDVVVEVVTGVPEYRQAFQKVFGREPTIDDIVAVDRHLRADGGQRRTRPSTASMRATRPRISESAQRGWELWNGKARCNTCHPFGDATPNFSDNKFHNIGVAAKGRDFAGLAREGRRRERTRDELAFNPDFTELGRFVVTKQPKDIGAFKTPGPARRRADRALHARRQRGHARSTW